MLSLSAREKLGFASPWARNHPSCSACLSGMGYCWLESALAWGWPLPSGIPLWAGILILVVLYQVLVTPIRAGRQASLYAFGPGHFGLATFWDGFVWLGLLTAFGWLLYTRMPEVHTVREFIDHVPEALKSLVG